MWLSVDGANEITARSSITRGVELSGAVAAALGE